MSTSAAMVQVDTRSLLAGPEGKELRRVWVRLFLFLLPLFVILGPAIYKVDPYCLFRHPSIVPESVRSKYALRLNPVLWKLLAYEANPTPNVLLGDSQMDKLPEPTVRAVTGEAYTNLAYDGGTLRESIATFWYVSGRTKLQHVYFQISFMNYTSKLQNRVPQAEDILHDRVLYFMNSDVIEAGAYDVADSIFHHTTSFEQKESKDVFWQSQLDYLAGRYKRDADPGSLKNELGRIVAYCRSHGISFAFVITPQSIDAQREVEHLRVEDQYKRFKSDLTALAPVYDCDIDSSLSRNKESFRDPFHMEAAAAEQFASDLWSGHPTLCRTLGAE